MQGGEEARSETYLVVRCNDERRSQRRRWAFFNSLLKSDFNGRNHLGRPDMNRRTEEEPVVTIARRELFELGAAVGLALLAGRPEPTSAAESGAEPPGSKREAQEDLLRMLAEIRKAL